MPINSDLSNNCGKKYIKNLLQATQLALGIQAMKRENK